MSPHAANRTIEGPVIQPNIFERDLSFADTILKQEQLDARRNELELATREARLAMEAFQVLGARPGLDRAQSVLRRLGVRTAAGPPLKAGLSRREVDVAQLVGLGLSNDQIAARLFLSPRTVEHHITSILRKLPASGRAEIAAYAVRHLGTDSALALGTGPDARAGCGRQARGMNEFTRADRIKWIAVTIGVAAAAVPLSFVLWRTPPGVATPPPSLLPFFIPIGMVIPAVAVKKVMVSRFGHGGENGRRDRDGKRCGSWFD